jgi:hypothetical protein
MLDDFFDKTASIYGVMVTQNAAGAAVNTWPSVRWSGSCMLAPASVRAVNQFAVLDMLATFELYTTCDVQSRVNDKVVIDGITHFVIGYQPFGNTVMSSQVYTTVLGKRNQPAT